MADIFRKIRKRKKQEDELFGKTDVSTAQKSGGRIFRLSGKNERLCDIIAPNGVNTAPLPYMSVNDGGVETYYMGFVLLRNAKRPTIASTYTRLADYPGMTSSVYIHPLQEESISITNRRIQTLDAELETSEDNRIRQRELSGKLADVEELARKIDSGDSTLYEVYFLYLLRRPSLPELYEAAGEVAAIARSQNMELSATYAAHPETFLSTLPVNKLYRVSLSRNLPGFMNFKKFIMDETSLSTTFNHSTAEFFHKDGVLLGHNMYSGLPFTFDPFDKSRFSYGMIICGMPGYGKSATVKQLSTRLVDFGYSFASIDYENNGARGEYAAACRAVGGVSYTIGRKNGDRLNLFDLNEEIDIDEITGGEYRVLRVDDKIVDLTNILLSIALTAADEQTAAYEAAEVDRMKEIIKRVVQGLYRDRGICDGEPDSLYEEYAGEDVLASGIRKKTLPRMKDFYLGLLRAAAANRDSFKKNAYALLTDKFYDRVEDMWYCPECLKEIPHEDVLRLNGITEMNGIPYHRHDGGKAYPIVHVQGTSAYFDCQSTVSLNSNRPWYNFDISGAPESERPVLILICQSFINEFFIKRNSVDPKKAKKLVFIVDEFHKIKQPKAIAFMSSTYRIARKRHCAPLIITQSIADLNKYDEAEDIVKETETMMLLKHQFKDREAIKEATFLSDSQVDAVLSLGGDYHRKRYGELCVVDMAIKQASFVKVDYLKGSEELIVETDTEKRAAIERKNK